MILHLTPRTDWLAAQKTGEYRVPSLQTEGFIHCSTEKQIVKVADSFYADRHGLVLLVIDPALLHSKMRWERPAHPDQQADLPHSEELFPHIYGPLNLDAVIRVLDFEPNLNGKFTQPRFD